MFPKYNFDDSLAQIERLGKKRELQVHMQRYRLDQLTRDDEQPINDLDDEMNEPREGDEFVEPPMDEFEALIDEQIALSRTNVGKTMDKSFGNVSSISGIEPNMSSSQTMRNSSFFPPNDSQQSQPDPPPPVTQISDEVRARIAENRRKAMELREQKKRQEEEQAAALAKSQTHTQEISNMIFDDDDIE